MKLPNSFITSILRLFISLLLILVQVSDLSSQKLNLSILPQGFSLPSTLGWVDKTYVGSSARPLVLHIQDLHGDFMAQRKIAEIIHWFHRQSLPIGLVGLEGAQGPIDLNEIKALPQQEIRETLADYLLTKGWIAGAERAVVSVEYSLPLFGVENSLFYRANLHALQKLILFGEGSSQMIENRVKRWMAELRPEIRIFMRYWLDFENGKMNMQSLLPYLEKVMIKKKIKMSYYSHFSPFVKTWKKIQTIDQKEISQIQEQWVKALAAVLPAEKLKKLVQDVLLYRSRKIEPVVFFERLEKLSRPYHFSELNRENLHKYLEHLKAMKSVEWEKVISDIESIFKAIYHTFGKKDKTWLNGIRKAQTLKKILLAQASRKDIHSLDQDEFLVLSGFSKHERKQIRAHLESAKYFYLLAEARDRILLDNFVNEMRRINVRVGILITGGFHTEGLQSLMEKKDFSYVCISPRLEAVDEKAYWKMISKERTSFEKSLLADRYRLALPSLYGALADTDTKRLFQLKKSLVSKVLGLFNGLNIRSILKKDDQEESLHRIKERAPKALQHFLREWTLAYRESLKAKYPPHVVREKIQRFENELAAIKFDFEDLKIESGQVIIPLRIEDRQERYLLRFGTEDPLKIDPERVLEDESWGEIKAEVSSETQKSKRGSLKEALAGFEQRIRTTFQEGLRGIPGAKDLPGRIDQLPKFSQVFRVVHLLGVTRVWGAFRKNPLPILLMAKFIDERKWALLNDHFGAELAEILTQEDKIIPWIGALSVMDIQTLERRLNVWKGDLKEFLERILSGHWSKEVQRSKVSLPQKGSVLKYFPGKRILSFGTALVVLFTSFVAKAEPPGDLRSLLVVPSEETVQPRGPREITKELEKVREELRQMDEKIQKLKDRRALLSSSEGMAPLQQNFQLGSGEFSGQMALAPHLFPWFIRPPGDLLDMRLGVIYGDNPQLGLLPSPFFTLGMTFRKELNTDYPRFLKLQYALLKARGNIGAFNILDDRLLSIFSGAGQVSRSFSLLSHPRAGGLYLDLVFSGNAAASVDQDKSWNFLNFQAAQGLQMRWRSPQDRFGLRFAYNLTGDLFPEGLIVPSDVDFSDLSLVLGHSALAEISTKSLGVIHVPELTFGFEERFMHRSRRDRFYGYAGIDIGSREPLWLNVDLYRDIPNEPGRADILTVPLLREQARAGIMVPIGSFMDWGQGHFYWQAGHSKYLDVPHDEFYTMAGLSLNMAPSRQGAPAHVNTTVEYRTGSGLQTDSVRGLVRSGILETGFKSLNYDQLSLSAQGLLDDLLSDLDPLIVLIIRNTSIEDIPGNIPADFVDRETRELIELIINRILASGAIPGETTVQNLLRPENLRKVLPLFTEDILDFVAPMVETKGLELLKDRPITRSFLIGAYTLMSQGTHYLDLKETILKEIKLKDFIGQYTDNETLIDSLNRFGEEIILTVSRTLIAQLIIELEEDARRLMRVSSASGGQTALEMNQAELSRVSRGSRERVRRQMAQQMLDALDHEIKGLEKERERLETRRQRLEQELFKASMTQGGLVRIDVLGALGLMGVATSASEQGMSKYIILFTWFAIGTWLVIQLLRTYHSKFLSHDLYSSLLEIVKRAEDIDLNRKKNVLFSESILYKIFGEPIQFPVPQEALGRLDYDLYFNLVLRAIKEDSLGMSKLLLRRDPLFQKLNQLELPESVMRILKRSLAKLHSDLSTKLPPVGVKSLGFAKPQNSVDAAA